MSTSYGYCRQSTEQQASIGMQKGIVLDLANRNERQLPERQIRSEIESANSVPYTERPEFRKIMQEIKPGDWLFAWRLDRIERNPLRLPRAMEWFMNNQIVICTQMEGVIDMATLHGRMLVYGQQMICDMFLTYLSEATKSGLQYKRKNGFSMGYRIGRKRVPVSGARTNRDKPSRTHVWCEEDMSTIREIYHRAINGESLNAIAEDFHEQGRRDCEGRAWVKRRSSHPRYAPRGPWSPRRVKEAYTWYRKFVMRGIEPEWFDPNSSGFLTHYQWNQDDEALIQEVVAKLQKTNCVPLTQSSVQPQSACDIASESTLTAS